ncbi:hypothetical protein [Streptomyces sp. NPDC057257]
MPRWHHEWSWLAREWQRAAYTALNLWRKSDPALFAAPIRKRGL